MPCCARPETYCCAMPSLCGGQGANAGATMVRGASPLGETHAPTYPFDHPRSDPHPVQVLDGAEALIVKSRLWGGRPGGGAFWGSRRGSNSVLVARGGLTCTPDEGYVGQRRFVAGVNRLTRAVRQKCAPGRW